MVKICLLTGLKEIVGHDEIQIAHSGRLSALLEDLCNRYGERLSRFLYDPENPGQRNPFVKVLVDGEDIKDKDPGLIGNETIVLFLPIAGG